MAVFKEGDVVVLKSGGPKMTVDRLESPEWLHLRWFAGSKMETARVKVSSLQTAPTAPAKP